MFEEFDEYEPTDLDDEMFLSEVPLSLIEQSMTAQFDNPTEYRKKDYIQTFITRYNYTKSNILDYEDDIEGLEELYSNFFAFVLNIFDSYLGVGFDCIDNKSEDDGLELLHLTYRFFIKNIKKNFVTLILNYLAQHRETIIQSLTPNNSVTALSFQYEGVDEDDVLIISNLDEVIDFILGQPFTVDEFIELCESDKDCLETDFVKTNFDEFNITGNFVPQYIEMIDDYLRSEIESKLRNKILKKYPNRKKEYIPEVNDIEE